MGSSSTLSSQVLAASAAARQAARQREQAARQRDPAAVLPWLPCTLALEVAVVGMTVGHLLRLQPGALVQTASHQSTDVPLQVNGVLMAWTEFEVVGERLAARITDLA